MKRKRMKVRTLREWVKVMNEFIKDHVEIEVNLSKKHKKTFNIVNEPKKLLEGLKQKYKEIIKKEAGNYMRLTQKQREIIENKRSLVKFSSASCSFFSVKIILVLDLAFDRI